MEEFGVSQELLAGQANTTAVAYDKLSGSASDAFAKIGQLLAQGLKPAAEELTVVFKNVTDGLNGLSSAGGQKLAITQAFFEGSQSAEQFNQKVVQSNAIISQAFSDMNLGVLSVVPGINAIASAVQLLASNTAQFQQVTQGQFLFLKDLELAGANADKLRIALQATAEQAQELDRIYSRVGETLGISREQFDAFAAAVLQASQLNEQGAITADAFLDAVLSGSEGVVSATERLNIYIESQRVATVGTLDGSDAHERHAQAVLETANALSTEAVEAEIAAAQTAILKQRQEEIYAAALNAASGMGIAGNAAAQMASQFGIAEQKAADLINMLRNLKIAQNLANADTPAEQRFVGANALAGRAVDLDAFRKQQKALEGVNDAIRDQKFEAADAAGKVRLLKDELTKLVPGSEAYIRKQTEIMRAEESLEKSRKKAAKGAGGKAPKLTANEKLNNQLLSQQEKFDNKMEDLEESHQEKLLEIIEDFAKRQLEVQKENEIQKRRSRFDFYTDLQKSQLSPIDKQKFAAQYEEAFAQAQKIAQEGKAKLSQEFLKLKEDHIRQLEELAQEEQDIRTDEDLSKGEKQARLDELENRKKLLLDAQREEEKQLLEGGDKVQNEFNERIAEENKAYEEQANKIITAADRAGDAKIANAERSKIAVSNENKVLADQLILYDKIRQQNGGKLPTPTQTAPTTTVATTNEPAPVTAPEAIPVTTDTPLPVATPDALIVKQFELFVVRDQGVIDAVVDQTARIEGKFDLLGAKVDNITTVLSGRLDSLRAAIGTIKAVKP